MNKHEDRAVIAVIAVWLLGLLLSLAFWGVVVWAIVEFISWLVTK
jgi:hypothetical protein